MDRREDVQRSRDAGFAAHLTKPASREAIVAAVASVTEADYRETNPKRKPGPALCASGWWLDLPCPRQAYRHCQKQSQ